MLEKGTVVMVRAGKEKGRAMVVVGYEKDYPLLCDGKHRPVDRPKKKNPRHIAVTSRVLDAGSYSRNKAIRKELRPLNETI